MRLTHTLSALALAGGLFASSLTLAAPVKYEVDPTHSFVTFSISHLGFSFLQGRFNELSGELSYDADNPSASRIEMEVKTASIDSNHAERDRHLRGSDFLNVARFPTATFVTTGFEPRGEDGVLKGDLTLHGVTRPIRIEVEFVGAGTDPWGGQRRGYNGRTSIKRSDFGMTYNLGPDADAMDLHFVIEGVRK